MNPLFEIITKINEMLAKFSGSELAEALGRLLASLVLESGKAVNQADIVLARTLEAFESLMQKLGFSITLATAAVR